MSTQKEVVKIVIEKTEGGHENLIVTINGEEQQKCNISRKLTGTTGEGCQGIFTKTIDGEEGLFFRYETYGKNFAFDDLDFNDPKQIEKEIKSRIAAIKSWIKEECQANAYTHSFTLPL